MLNFSFCQFFVEISVHLNHLGIIGTTVENVLLACRCHQFYFVIGKKGWID